MPPLISADCLPPALGKRASLRAHGRTEKPAATTWKTSGGAEARFPRVTRRPPAGGPGREETSERRKERETGAKRHLLFSTAPDPCIRTPLKIGNP